MFEDDFHSRSRARTQQTDPMSIVRPDMEAYAEQLKTLSIVFGIGIAVGFLCFLLGGISAASSFQPGVPGLVIFGFICFGACGFLSAMFTAKSSAAQQLVQLMRQVKASDKTLIQNLSFGQIPSHAHTLQAVKALISTGNLQGYEVVADFIVAKTSLNLRPEDVIAPSPAPAPQAVILKSQPKPQIIACPACGGTFGETDKFCTYCGARLPR